MSEAETAKKIADFATKFGINNKTLGLLLPSMSASQVSNLVNNHKYNEKFTDEVGVALLILEAINVDGVLPCSPKTLYPRIMLSVAEKVLLRLKYQYTLEELQNDPVWVSDLGDAGELPFNHPNHDWDIVGLTAVSKLLANSIDA